MIAVLEELVDVATLRAMVEAALRWPLELIEDLIRLDAFAALEDLYTSARSRFEHACWLHGFVGFGGAP